MASSSSSSSSMLRSVASSLGLNHDNWLPASPSAHPYHHISYDSEYHDLESLSSGTASTSTSSFERYDHPSDPDAAEARSGPKRPVLTALLKLSLVFLIGSIVLASTLWLVLPPLDDADRLAMKMPKTFDELKALNALMKKLKAIYPVRTVICFIVSFLYVQAFSLPGSMYLAILGGAVWGVPFALPLASFCTATGASLCYLISACFGPALLALPRLRVKIEYVAKKVGEPHHRANIIPYLMILRMVPVPPNWAVNLACPHLGVDIWTFWLAAFLGILGLSAIHTSIGSGLDQMTSSEDIHLLSWPNAFAVLSVVAGALLPILVRRHFRKETDEIDSTAATAVTAHFGPAGIIEEPQTRELSTLSTVIFDATDFGCDNETPIGSLGLIGVGRTPVTAELWPERRISLLLPDSRGGKEHAYEYARTPSFEYLNMHPVSSVAR